MSRQAKIDMNYQPGANSKLTMQEAVDLIRELSDQEKARAAICQTLKTKGFRGTYGKPVHPAFVSDVCIDILGLTPLGIGRKSGNGKTQKRKKKRQTRPVQQSTTDDIKNTILDILTANGIDETSRIMAVKSLTAQL